MSAVPISGGLTGAWRLVIQPRPEGAYLFVFETESSPSPERDYLQDTVEEAFARAEEDSGAARRAWTPWEGPSRV